MKKLILLSLVGLLVACEEEGTKEIKEVKTETSEEVEVVEIDPNEPTQEELNAKLKSEATEINFVEVFEKDSLNKKVYLTGEVSFFQEDSPIDTFTLTVKEGEDAYGMYSIKSINTTDAVFTEGDTIKVYGTVSEPDESGFPTILSTFVETEK